MIYKENVDNSPVIDADVETPELAFVPRENAMSFGMVGQQQFKPAQIMLSEQSDDFYMNSGRSNHTKMSSQASVEVKGAEFAHLTINSVNQAQTEASNAYQTHHMKEKFKIEATSFAQREQQYDVQTQQPRQFLVNSDHQLRGQNTQSIAAEQQESMPPMYLSETPQSFNENQGGIKRHDFDDKITGQATDFLSH